MTYAEILASAHADVLAEIEERACRGDELTMADIAEWEAHYEAAQDTAISPEAGEWF